MTRSFMEGRLQAGASRLQATGYGLQERRAVCSTRRSRRTSASTWSSLEPDACFSMHRRFRQSRRRRPRQLDREGRALAFRAREGDLPAVRLDDLTGDVEAEAE